MDLLQVDHVSKKGKDEFSLHSITFSLNRFKKLVVAGETGSGKSTLLKLIAGLEQPDSGRIVFEGERVRGPSETLVPGHPRIAYLSQQFELAKFLRVEQVLDYANKFATDEFNRLVEICQIDHLIKRTTDQLSGGERQRIALCRLLIGSPKLLLLDEPYSHLDLTHKATLKRVVADLCTELKITCILVSHDPDDTLSWADKIVVLRGGRVVQFGTPRTVYSDPSDEYTAGLFGSYNLIPSHFLTAFRLKLKAVDGHYLVRPEQLVISQKQDAHVKAIVEGNDFYGSHYNIRARVGEVPIVVRGRCPVHAGKQLYLKVIRLPE